MVIVVKMLLHIISIMAFMSVFSVKWHVFHLKTISCISTLALS